MLGKVISFYLPSLFFMLVLMWEPETMFSWMNLVLTRSQWITCTVIKEIKPWKCSTNMSTSHPQGELRVPCTSGPLLVFFFGLFVCFVLFCFVLFCFVLFCFVLLVGCLFVFVFCFCFCLLHLIIYIFWAMCLKHTSNQNMDGIAVTRHAHFVKLFLILNATNAAWYHHVDKGGTLISVFKMSLLCEPRSKHSWGDRAFSIAAPRLWNTLPADIKNSPSLAHFKGSLKTHLMKEAFA